VLDGETEYCQSPVSPSSVSHTKSPNLIGLGLKFVAGGDGGGLNSIILSLCRQL
jgi:hypothetical protein